MNGYIDCLKTYATGVVLWIYPHEEEPPRGVKLHILQEGGVSIQSVWIDDAGYLGFQRMFKRSHEKEKDYKDFLIMRKKAKNLLQ